MQFWYQQIKPKRPYTIWMRWV